MIDMDMTLFFAVFCILMSVHKSDVCRSCFLLAVCFDLDPVYLYSTIPRLYSFL